MWRGSSQSGSGYQEGFGADATTNHQQLLDATTQINASYLNCHAQHQAPLIRRRVSELRLVRAFSLC